MTHRTDCQILVDRGSRPCTCQPQPDARRVPVTRYDVHIYQDGAWEDIESPTGKWVMASDYHALADRLAASETEKTVYRDSIIDVGQALGLIMPERVTFFATEGVRAVQKLEQRLAASERAEREAVNAFTAEALVHNVTKQRLAEVERERDNLFTITQVLESRLANAQATIARLLEAVTLALDYYRSKGTQKYNPYEVEQSLEQALRETGARRKEGKMIAVLAGTRDQFEQFIRERQIPRTEARCITDERDLRGGEFTEFREVGTWLSLDRNLLDLWHHYKQHRVKASS